MFICMLHVFMCVNVNVLCVIHVLSVCCYMYLCVFLLHVFVCVLHVLYVCMLALYVEA